MSDEQKPKEPEKELIDQTVRRFMDSMREHFDTVSVFCTRVNPETGHTESYQHGDGNWFARYGYIEEWVTKQRRRAECEATTDFNEEQQP